MKLDVIYADPPWTFETYSNKGKGKSPEQHYTCMSMQDIKDLPVNDIASNNSACFLWITGPLLMKGGEVLEAWGFNYITIAFVWIKKNKVATDTNFWGLGHWSRSNAELVLLGTKGHPKRASKSVHQVVETLDDFETETIQAPVGNHSVKPPEVRIRIETLMGPETSKIVLFGRKESDGWLTLGNEIDGKDIRESLPELILK